jgi:arylsulfatase A-like enzyme
VSRAWAIACAALAAWAVAALWAVPALIRSAYAGESLPIFNRLVSGQARTPVETYLAMWRSLALNATVAVVAAVLLALVTVRLARRMRQVHAETRGTSQGFGAGDVFLSALWIGILAGLAEAANGIVRHRVQHMPTGEVVSAELFWLVPLAAAVTFSLIGILLIALDRVLGGRLRLLRLAPAIFAGLAVYSLLRALGVGLANYAVIILALGVGAAAFRALTSYTAPVRWLFRRTTPWLVFGLVVWAVVVPLWRRAVEWRAVADLPAASAAAPNVLLIIWDTARALNLSLYGYARETTPELQRFAQRGAVFDRAFSTASWSLPSHGSMFTGRYPHEMTVGRQIPLDETHPTLAEVLSGRGYVTGGFTANLFYGSADYGIARGFTWYDARPALRASTVGHTWWLSRTILFDLRAAFGNRQHMLRRRAAYVNGALLRWLSRHDDRPFFAVVNNFDTHEPYLPPEPFNLTYNETQPRYWFTEDQHLLPRDVLAQLTDAYDSSIRYVDHELGRLLDALEESGKLDNTVVIVTSDHGEDFGEHGVDVFGHARSIYATSVLVPLVLVYPPRVPAGVRVRDAVSIRDIPATVMDVLGLGEQSPFPGTSLARYADGTATEAERAEPRLSSAEKHPWANEDSHWPAAIGNLFSLATSDVHYIVDGRGEEFLFDLSADVLEQNDLADSAAYAPVLENLRRVLDSLVLTPDGTRRVRMPRRPRRLRPRRNTGTGPGVMCIGR